MPPITVEAPKTPSVKPSSHSAVQSTATASASTLATQAPTAAQAALDQKMQAMDQARENLLPKLGATSYTLNHDAIEALPQGDNTPIDKVILQTPGVSYDSAVSNPSFHVRNEYANVQYRINGIVLPEGVSGLGPVIDTNFVGSMSLLTGTLPAQYGLRTAGVLDITSRTFAAPEGNFSLYGGSHGTFTPSIDYGGSTGDTQYFFTGRGNWNSVGIENPTPAYNANHDETEQGKFFGYMSTLLDSSTRFSVITGASYSQFQIPNNPNQTPFPGTGLPNYNSSSLNENEYDRFIYDIAVLQTKSGAWDSQLSVFYRYANVHFVPDLLGDLVFNGVASDVTRESNLYGTQFDTSYQLNNVHTLRAGFAVSAEQTNVTNRSTVLQTDSSGNPIPGTEETITDANSLLGWNIGTYVQDEWKITNTLTLNSGLRFDQLYQFVDANQLSPRETLVYKPFDGTTLHIGYARYFTPPMQAQATQSNLDLWNGTTNQPDVPYDDPVKPERSNYYDVGIDQKVLPGLNVGLDAYYKDAKDLLDDGQFGQAVVLTQFNWAEGYAEGAEIKAKYQNGDFKAYGNFAYGITRAKDAVSNQYLLDSDEYTYLLTHYHNTDDMQLMTGSAGASYKWDKNLATVDVIYGSGLSAGEYNCCHTPPYTSVNLGVSHEFQLSSDQKPLTVRFDVVNLFDEVYELRDGTGIGVFAPQYGPRRGFFVGMSQKF
ncbi:MAG: TonB-dependent receptor [Rhodomicrobium sp.]